MSLPDPHLLSRGEEARHRHTETWQAWLGHAFARAARRMLRDLMRAIF